MALSGEEKAQMEKIPSSRRAMIDVYNEARKPGQLATAKGRRRS